MIDPTELYSLVRAMLATDCEIERRKILLRIETACAEADRQLAARHGAPWAAGDTMREIGRAGRAE